MTRRATAATTASRSGSRSSASGAAPNAKATRSKAKARKAARATVDPTTATVPAADAGSASVAPEVVPTRRGRARRGQGDQLREEILDATQALLTETGSVDKVSTRAVAQRVGCSSPALYLHFPDKAALLWATCNRQFQRLRVRIVDAVEGVDDPVEALRAVGRAYVTFGVEHPEEYRVMMMVPDAVVWNPPIADLPLEAGFDIVYDLLERAMAAGRVRRDDPTLVAITVWTAVHGLVALLIAKPTFEWPALDELTERTLDMVVVGLAAPDDPGPAAAPEGRSRRTRSSSRSRRSAS